MITPDKETGVHDKAIRGSKVCSHEGMLYSEGSEICPEGVCSACKSGRWELKISDIERYPTAD
jgi:hypothetical protein